MTREQIVLAAMAAGGQNATYSPAQVQKLLFLLDREASQFLGGPHFNFTPYNYGPFDSAVYDSLDRLALRQLVHINNGSSKYRQYTLSRQGQDAGMSVLDGVGANVKTYMAEVASWILSMDFQTLVSTIYVKYPDMKVNSVFVA